MREYKADDKFFSYTGRFDFSTPGCALFAWPSSAVSFCVKAQKLVVEMQNFSPVALGFENNYFTVVANGVEAGTIRVDNDTRFYDLSQYINPEKHVTVKLFKRTEAVCGKVKFYGLELDNGGELTLAPPEKDIFIEFIGDSITCGKDNEAPVCDGSFAPELENAWKSWASVAARQLDADWSLISFSGKGMWRNHDLSSEFTMPVLYDRIIPQSTGKWDFTKRIPDVIAINLGTNDFLYRVAFPDVFAKAYADFVTRLMGLYPDCTIVCCSGPMLADEGHISCGVGKCPKNSRKIFEQSLDMMLDMLGHPENVYRCTLSSIPGLDPEPSDHPGINLHAANGKEFAEFASGFLKTRSKC